MQQPMNSNKPLIASTNIRQFIFLASHGLRNSLTAINWSYGRLKKVEEHTEAGQMYLDQIGLNTKRLTQMLSTIFLLSRIQNEHPNISVEPCQVLKELQNAVVDEEMENSPVHIKGEEYEISTNKEVLSTLLSALLLAFYAMDPISEPHDIYITVEQLDTGLHIHFESKAYLQLLRNFNPDNLTIKSDTNQLVGGTPGLLLSLAKDISSTMGWSMNLENQGQQVEVHLQLS